MTEQQLSKAAPGRRIAVWIERGPPIWYRGLKPPLALSNPRLLARVRVDWPNQGRSALGLAGHARTRQTCRRSPENLE